MFLDVDSEMLWPQPWVGRNPTVYRVLPGLRFQVAPELLARDCPKNVCVPWLDKIGVVGQEVGLADLLVRLTLWRPRPSSNRRDALMGQLCCEVASRLEEAVRAALEPPSPAVSPPPALAVSTPAV